MKIRTLRNQLIDMTEKRSDYSSHTNRLISDTGTHQRQKERNYPGRI